LSEDQLFRQASGVSMNLGGYRLQYDRTPVPRRTHAPSMAEEDEDSYSSTEDSS